MAHLVVSRSGATALADFIEMEVPSILIPLPRGSSRGDQEINAKLLEKRGGAIVLDDETLTSGNLLIQIRELFGNDERRKMIIKNLHTLKKERSEKKISLIILDTLSKIHGSIG